MQLVQHPRDPLADLRGEATHDAEISREREQHVGRDGGRARDIPQRRIGVGGRQCRGGDRRHYGHQGHHSVSSHSSAGASGKRADTSPTLSSSGSGARSVPQLSMYARMLPETTTSPVASTSSSATPLSAPPSVPSGPSLSQAAATALR